MRSGVIGIDDYLGLLGKTIANVLRGSDRLQAERGGSPPSTRGPLLPPGRERTQCHLVSYYAKGR